jgi:hypothetical protein
VRSQIKNPAWQWVFGVMACYGTPTEIKELVTKATSELQQEHQKQQSKQKKQTELEL